MKNNISIDELVRRHASQGEEPHNLGAWANMERMLDGENPYEKEEDKKKRPWLFLFFGLLICSSAVVGGYQYFNNTTSNAIAKNNQSPVVNSNTAADNMLIADKNEVLDLSDAEPSNSYANENYNSNVNESEAYSSSTESNDANELDYYTSAQSKETTETVIADTKGNNAFVKKEVSNSTNTRIAKQTSETMETLSERKASHIGINATQPALEEYAKKEPLLNEKQEVVKPTITESYLDTTQVTEITQRIDRSEGKKRYVSDSMRYKVVQEKQRIVVNPRYVALSKEQEAAAERRTGLASSNNDLAMVANTPKKVATNTNTQVNDKTEVGLQKQVSSKKQQGFFSLFKKAANNVNQKAINISHKRFPIYTGMFAGINAALLNTQHNFGGFQTGLTAMTPINRIFTIQTGLRFTHMNNSAYTVRDNRKDILSTSVDSSSIFKSKIYNYQVDSVSRGYNLKNFYSLHMPIMLNANIKKFSVFGGINVHYGFRMNVVASQQSNIISIIDTIADGASYSPRVNSDMKFTTDDFGSRLGLGYTVGGAYNFNPNLYIDLRMANPILDNTKGAAKQEISDVFFKIPSFQLSLGYRFRSYKPE